MKGRSYLLALFMSTAGCSLAPVGKLPPECSGVPGDFRTPNSILAVGTATHGPGAQQQPVELVAVARPPTGPFGFIPLLYVFDPEGNYVSDAHPSFKLLADPVFVQVEKEAYWGEIEGNHYYRIPWLDKCSQAAMLEKPVSFRAPPNGIMFMQFLAPGCAECGRITQAITAFVRQNPETSVRWIRVSVPGTIGSLNR